MKKSVLTFGLISTFFLQFSCSSKKNPGLLVPDSTKKSILDSTYKEEYTEESFDASKADSIDTLSNKQKDDDRFSLVGKGYDTTRNNLLESHVGCVNGNLKIEPINSTDISFDKKIDYDSLERSYSAEIGGSANASVLVKLSAAFKFLDSVKETSYSKVILHSLKVVTHKEYLTGVTLKNDPQISGMLNTPDKWMNRCGDQYVSAVEYGATFDLAVKLVFNSESKKKKFSEKFGVSKISIFDLSLALEQMIEDEGIEGKMQIILNQRGGDSKKLIKVFPNTSTECSLTNIEEYNVCKDLLDNLEDYVKYDFSRDAQNKYVMLKYYTEPLRKLDGVDINWPHLPDDIYQIRDELAILHMQQFNMKDRVTAYSDLDIHQSYTDTIEAYKVQLDNNIKNIQRVIDICFNPDVDNSPQEPLTGWARCRNSYNTLPSMLATIDEEQIKQNEIEIPVNNMKGVPIMNYFRHPIKIAVSVSGDWKFSKSGDLVSSLAGLSEPCRDKCPAKDEKRGALMKMVDSSLTPFHNIEEIEIAPGEGVVFLINDERDHYKYNSGALNMTWVCLNCTEGMPKYSKGGYFTVDATTNKGTKFTNETDDTAKVKMFANGLWTTRGDENYIDAGGESKSCGISCPLSKEPLAGLIFTTDDEEKYIGKRSEFSLSSSEQISLKINEWAATYNDNLGFQTVFWIFDGPEI